MTEPMSGADLAEIARKEKPEIVVLDDEEPLLDMLRDFLEMEGFRVTCLSHPGQIECLKSNHDPCLYLIDLMLPEMDGLEVAAKLRREQYANAPFVAMSASTIMVQSAKFAELFAETINKPFDLGALRKTVQRYAA